MIIPGTITAVSEYPDRVEPNTSPDDNRDIVDTDSGIQRSLKESRRAHHELFVKAAEYMDENRQFVIRIEKDGLIPALRKLDIELKNVGYLSWRGDRADESFMNSGWENAYFISKGMILCVSPYIICRLKIMYI